MGSSAAGVTARCAFCGKPLPVAGDTIKPWRSAAGQVFCTEFCADDADEAQFQRRRRRGGHDRATRTVVRSDAT